MKTDVTWKETRPESFEAVFATSGNVCIEAWYYHSERDNTWRWGAGIRHVSAPYTFFGYVSIDEGAGICADGVRRGAENAVQAFISEIGAAG